MSAAQEASACQGRGAKSLHRIRKRASAGTSKGHVVAEHGQGKSHVPMPRKCASTTCMDYVCIKVLRVGGGVLHLHALTVAVMPASATHLPSLATFHSVAKVGCARPLSAL